MKPKRITFIRHGESVGNVDRTVYTHTPDWKIALTEHGKEQAVAAGESFVWTEPKLKDLGVYVSPYKRTRQTWENMKLPIAMSGVDIKFVKEDPRLREQEWGNLRPNGFAKIEQERESYGPFFYRFAHGESGADVYDRATGFLNTIYRDFEKSDFPENVLIVTHGFTMRILLMRWLHWTAEHFHGLKNPHNCEMHTIELQSDGKYRLITEFEEETIEFRQQYQNQFFD
jgi:broad specificity phosphatase PhoE